MCDLYKRRTDCARNFSAISSPALETIEASCPDILLLDLTGPGGGSLELIRALRHRPNAPRVLVLTMHDDPAYARSALHSGAVGYVVKTVGEVDLLAAIRAVSKGQVFIDLDDAEKSSAHRGRINCSEP